MAGASACANVTVPKRRSRASHPDRAPGTVTSSTLSCGIVAWPFASSASRVMRLPARPLPLSPYSRRSLADHTMANMSPPIPVICGSTTLSTAAAVTAASTALPPRASTARPAAVARGWLVAIMPCGAYTVERCASVVGRGGCCESAARVMVRSRVASVRWRVRGMLLVLGEALGDRVRDVAGARAAAEIRRPHPRRQRFLDGALQVPSGGGMTQLLEHQRAREHRRYRVGDALPREQRSGAVHRLEQSPAAGVEVRARREAEATDEPRAQVGEDVAVQVVCDDDLKALGLAHQLQRKGVHVAVLGADAGERRRDSLERLLPHLVGRHGVGLVAHRDARLATRRRPLERGSDDPLDTLEGVDLLRDVPFAVDAALPEINSLRVFPKDDEVDRPAVAPQRGKIGVEQLHGAEVDVEIEPEPQS